MLLPSSVQEEYLLLFTIERFNLIPPQISRVVQYTPYNGSDLRLDTLYLPRESPKNHLELFVSHHYTDRDWETD